MDETANVRLSEYSERTGETWGVPDDHFPAPSSNEQVLYENRPRVVLHLEHPEESYVSLCGGENHASTWGRRSEFPADVRLCPVCHTISEQEGNGRHHPDGGFGVVWDPGAPYETPEKAVYEALRLVGANEPGRPRSVAHGD